MEEANIKQSSLQKFYSALKSSLFNVMFEMLKDIKIGFFN